MKRIGILINIYIVLSIFIVFSAFNASAYQNTDAYTLTNIGYNVNIYNITSDKQVENGVKGGEGAQLVFSMAYSPKNSSLMLLGNDTAGIYRSDDGGANWKVSSEGLMTPCINAVRFDEDDENIAYAAAATSSNSSVRVNKYKRIGLYKTYDGGITWTQKLVLCNEKKYTTLIASGKKQDDGTRPVFVGASNAADYQTLSNGATGLWVSYDKCETFECLGLEDRSINCIYADKETDLLIIASDKGIDISVDNGKSFVSANNGIENLSISAVTVNPEDKNHFIAGVIGDSGAYLAESKDKGVSWNIINGKTYGSSGSFISSLEFANIDGNIRLFMTVYRCSEPNRYSDDFGKNFNIPVFKVAESYSMLDSYGGYFPTPFCINPNNPNEIFTSKITPYKSTDGGKTFIFSASGYSGFLVYDWHFDNDGKVDVMAVTDLGILKMKKQDGTIFSTADKFSPVSTFGGTGAKSATSIAVDPNNSMHGFATVGGYIYDTKATVIETNDGFNTFTNYENLESIIESSDSNKSLSFVKYSPTNDNVVYTDCFVSEDNGINWYESEKRIRAISNFDGNTVYAMENYKIFKSDDRAKTWTDTKISIPTKGICRAFIADLFNKDVLWIAEHSMVYRVDLRNSNVTEFDGGRILLKSDSGGTLEIMDIEQNPRNKKHLILCTRDYNAGGGYVFETFDYGENWYRNDEIPYLAACSKIKFHPSCDLVFLASPMGTLVYDWSERIYKTEPYISENTYGSITKTFSISGNIGTKNAYAPISLILECDGAVKYFYFDYADELGYFSFKVPGIEDEKNEYTAKINAQGLETELQYSFQTPYEEPYDGEKPKAYYDSATGNIIITGKDNRKISETAFAGAVIATKSGESILGMTQSIIRPDGNYVLKMKIDSDAKTEDLNAVVTLYAGISFKIDIFNNTLPQYDYNTDVKVLSDTFRANIDFKYFFADKMNILAIAVCRGNDGQILSTSVKRQTFDYLPEQIEICENIPDNTFTLEVFVWDSETYKPLGSKTFISIKENNNG